MLSREDKEKIRKQLVDDTDPNKQCYLDRLYVQDNDFNPHRWIEKNVKSNVTTTFTIGQEDTAEFDIIRDLGKFFNKENKLSNQAEGAWVSFVKREIKREIENGNIKSVEEGQERIKSYFAQFQKELVEKMLKVDGTKLTAAFSDQQMMAMFKEKEREFRQEIPLTLDQYIKLYFAEDPPAAMLSRPFDTKNYCKYQTSEELKSGKTKEPGEYGANAKEWDISKMSVKEEVTKDSVREIHKMMEKVLEDIDAEIKKQVPEPHSDEQKKHVAALKSGYLFNAYNQFFDKEFKKADTEERKAELKQQAELVRFMADDVSKGMSVDKSYEQLHARYQKKLLTTVANCVLGQMGKDNPHPLGQNDKMTLKQLGMDEGQFKEKLRTLAVIGEQLINDTMSHLKNSSTELGKKHISNLDGTLNDMWARCATKIYADKEYNKGMEQFSAMSDMLIKGHDVSKEFQSALKFTKDILSIQRRYESKWGGIKHYVKSNEGKEKLIQAINNKLTMLLSDYPDKKNLGQIHSEMSKYLFDLCKNDPVLKGSSTFKEQIQRVAQQQQVMAIAARTTSGENKQALHEKAQLPEEGRVLPVFRR